MSCFASLGQPTVYPTEYSPQLLFPISRAAHRANLNLDTSGFFSGVDIWNAYEVSWLNSRGKPQIALARFFVPAESPYIVESKSFKLYLNSYHQTMLDDAEVLQQRLSTDLTKVVGAKVSVELTLHPHSAGLVLSELEGQCIDNQDITINTYLPAPELLRCHLTNSCIAETLCSHLLKSNCPVTKQPDWACVQIRYEGSPIDHDSLLRYLVSFRLYSDFHEHCVERIFCDLIHRCKPKHLTVYARFTRRGGIDINPWRSNFEKTPNSYIRTVRQ